MDNLNVVFKVIKECSKEGGIADETCFTTLESMADYNSAFLPIYSYMSVLEYLGLVKFDIRTKAIILTKRGHEAVSVFDYISRNN
jgi:hypothetical protein